MSFCSIWKWPQILQSKLFHHCFLVPWKMLTSDEEWEQSEPQVLQFLSNNFPTLTFISNPVCFCLWVLPSFGLDGLSDKPCPAAPQGAITWNSTPSAPSSTEKQARPSKMTLAVITNGQQVEDRQPEQPVSTRDASSERPTSLGTGREA